MISAIGIDIGATEVAVALVDSATGRVERAESYAAEFRESLEKAMRTQIWLEGAQNLPLLDAQLGEQAGVVGAASIARDRVQVGAL